MKPLTIEGTWEQVLQFADALAGKRVRVLVLDSLTVPSHAPNEATNMVEYLGDLIGCLELPGPPYAEDVSEVFSEIVMEKHSRREQR